MSIKIQKDGIKISANHVFKWECGKTGDAMSATADEFATADALSYAMTMGLEQSSADAYAGTKADADARILRNAKLAKVLAGTVGTGGGGKKADVVIQEMIAMILAESGMSGGAFKKAHGTGVSAVEAYVNDMVTEAIREADAEPGAYDAQAVFETNMADRRAAATAAIEARKAKASGLKLKLV